MKGQLVFDEFMHVSEEKLCQKVAWRTPMVDPCYYCLCNSCIYNAENMRVKPGEISYDYKSCFYCEDCRIFDGNTSKRDMEREQCSRYRIDNYHAENKRKNFKVVEVWDGKRCN